MKVLNEYPNSHHYLEEYNLDESLFCPGCSKATVYVEQSGGDYYEGPEHICISCDSTFSLPRGPDKTKEPNTLGIIEQLKTKTMKSPTTPKGG